MSIYKELIIGAVVIHDGKMKRVTGLTKDNVSLDESLKAVSKTEIEPVRITGGFLRKNGFEKDESISRILGCEAYKTPDGHICVRKIANQRGRSWNIHIENESWNSIANADVEHLHQMQAVLANHGIDFEINIKS